MHMKRLFFITLALVLICSAWGQSFKFALLTDLHITKDSLAFNDLLNAVTQVNQTPDIAFVLVTGDITENGDKASLVKAKSALDKLTKDYYIVSGNHECKWSESGATDFGLIYGSELFKFEYNGVLFLGFPTGPVIRMSDGHVSPQEISWLTDNLEKAGKEKPVFLVTHYPIQDGDVDNWYELTDAVRPYNIRAFLGGHYHSNRHFSYDGIPGFLNRSTLRAKEKKGGYSIYEVRPDSVLVYEHRIGETPMKWGGISMTERYYTADNSTYKRPDFSINAEYPSVTEKWTTSVGYGIYSSPVVYKKRVYVGDDSGSLSCLSLSSGRVEWVFKTGNRIVGTPAVATGVVVVGSADKFIYGLDADTGKLLWKQEAGAPVLGAVTIDKGVAYIGASDHCFRALDIKSGQQIWKYEGVKGYIETKPLVYKDKVIFGAWDNTLYALSQKEGKLLWTWDGGLTRMHFSPAAVWPVAAYGKVFITDPQRAMTAIDAHTGQTIWRTMRSMVRETIGLSKDQSRVYSKTMQDSLVCYSTVDEEPVQIWAVNVGYGYDHAPSMPVERENCVFGSTKNGLIFAVDAKDGRLLWKRKVANSLVNTVVPLGKNELLYSGSNGKVGILKWTTR